MSLDPTAAPTLDELVDMWVPSLELPTKRGWYAVLWCYDLKEGIFPGSDYFDNGWFERLPIILRSPEPFATKDEAIAWADKYDPES